MPAEQTAVVVTPALDPAALEKVLLRGDLSALSNSERVSYYRTVCESVGLNPLTQPFEYLELQGKLVLYARRSCSEQLRQLHKISVNIFPAEQVGDCYVVRATASTPDGRTDEDMGAVPIKGQSGERLANALMKAVTKAKRRVTLGICGLAFLDESELDTIRGAKRKEAPKPEELQASTPRPRIDPETGEVVPRPEGLVPELPGGRFEGFRLDDFHNVPREYLEEIAERAEDENIRAWARWLTAKVVE